jgi:hypothetical protein
VQQVTRHAQCSAASSWPPFSRWPYAVKPSYNANRPPRYFGSYCVFRTHPFYFVCTRIPLSFRSKCPPVLSRAFFSASPRHFGTHRTSSDLELLGLIQCACCGCCSMEWEKYICFVFRRGRLVCLFYGVCL